MIIDKEIIQINKDKQIVINHFVLPSHGIIGIRGKSGSGKTTILNHINHSQLSKYFPCHISYMKQNKMFFSFMNMMNNINFQLKIVHKDFDKDLFEQLINDFHLKHLINKKPKSLSVGEMQRFAFILQVLKQTPIILLDEPTASINEEYIQIMIKYLHIISKNSLIILTSHHPQMFEICDSIYEIQDNHLVCIKEVNDDGYTFHTEKNTFPVLDFTTCKFINQLKRNIIFYITIAVICSLLAAMHYIKSYELDLCMDLLNDYLSTELYLVKSEHPYDVNESIESLPLTDDEFNQLNSIEGISLYPVYNITNDVFFTIDQSFDSEYAPALIYSNNELLVCVEDMEIHIVPYYDEDTITHNVIEGQYKDNGIYISEYFYEYYQELSDYSQLSMEIDVSIPTNYVLAQSSIIGEDNYVFNEPVFYGTVEHLTFNSFDGVLDANYMGYSNNQLNVFVPYSYLEELESSYFPSQDEVVDGELCYAYTTGTYYIEVSDMTGVKEVKNIIKNISSDFHVFSYYTNLSESIAVYQEFKHTIDIFEYTGIGVVILLAGGFWYLRMRNDKDLKTQLQQLRLSSINFIKYILLDILLESVIVMMLSLIITNAVALILPQYFGVYYLYDVEDILRVMVFALILTALMRLIIEGKMMLYDRD